MKTHSNLRLAIDNLSNEDKLELDFLNIELTRTIYNHTTPGEPLKRSIAKFFLKLINESGEDSQIIQETSSIISSFSKYKFEDKLDEIISSTEQLQSTQDNPNTPLSEDLLEVLANLTSSLNKYLTGQGPKKSRFPNNKKF